MANPSIYRYEVPVGSTVEIALRGPLLPGAIAAREPHFVEFWAVHDPDLEPYVAKFVVMATGPELNRPIGGGLLAYIGTAITPDGALVWHLFKVVDEGLGYHVAEPLTISVQ